MASNKYITLFCLSGKLVFHLRSTELASSSAVSLSKPFSKQLPGKSSEAQTKLVVAAFNQLTKARKGDEANQPPKPVGAPTPLDEHLNEFMSSSYLQTDHPQKISHFRPHQGKLRSVLHIRLNSKGTPVTQVNGTKGPFGIVHQWPPFLTLAAWDASDAEPERHNRQISDPNGSHSCFLAADLRAKEKHQKLTEPSRNSRSHVLKSNSSKTLKKCIFPNHVFLQT